LSTNRRPARRAGIAALLGLLVVAFLALGVWQVQRRAWKHALIAAVDARVAAAPVAAPGPAAWPRLSAADDAYRHIAATGHYEVGRDTLVRAVSDLGAGYWVMTPLDTGRFTLLVNRGFVAQDAKSTYARPPEGTVRVVGLLRMSEPGGAFLRSNNPAAGRWYSRDVAAIAARRKLERTAPYFLDADAGANHTGAPVGGLTVIHFADNHAVYALTWFALALLSGWALVRILRQPAGAMD